jgi:hypothetical protein
MRSQSAQKVLRLCGVTFDLASILSPFVIKHSPVIRRLQVVAHEDQEIAITLGGQIRDILAVRSLPAVGLISLLLGSQSFQLAGVLRNG